MGKYGGNNNKKTYNYKIIFREKHFLQYNATKNIYVFIFLKLEKNADNFNNIQIFLEKRNHSLRKIHIFEIYGALCLLIKIVSHS